MREARWRESQQRMFDVQMMGGIVLHEGDIAEMKTGEGKTFVAAHRALPERAPGHRRPPRHRQRLPRQARRRVEPAGLRAARHDRRLHPEHDAVRASARRPTPPTSPTARTPSSASTTCATTWPSRKEGLVQRSHSYAIVDEVDSILIDEARTPLIISGEPETAAKTYYDFARIVEGARAPRRRRARARRARTRPSSPAPTTSTTRSTRPSRRAQTAIDDDRARAQDREPLRPAQRPARQPPEPGAQGAVAVPARRRLRDPGRRGEDRRRVHRPDHGRPALERGPAPGGRGEGGRPDPGGERHPRDDHAPELLPPLREARRHDRYRQDRGEGVRRDLRPPRRRDPDERRRSPAHDENDYIFKTKEAKFAAVDRRHRGAPREGPAGARRHDRGRDLRVPLASC